MSLQRLNAHTLAFIVGGREVSVEDFARAIAVHDGRGEDMKDATLRAVRIQDARDILDRAFRFARDARDQK